jgi:hypothetical protein
MACRSTQGSDMLKSEIINLLSDQLVRSAWLGSIRAKKLPGPDLETAVAAVLTLLRRAGLQDVSRNVFIAAMWCVRSIAFMDENLGDAVQMYAADAPAAAGDLHTHVGIDIGSLQN